MEEHQIRLNLLIKPSWNSKQESHRSRSNQSTIEEGHGVTVCKRHDLRLEIDENESQDFSVELNDSMSGMSDDTEIYSFETPREAGSLPPPRAFSLVSEQIEESCDIFENSKKYCRRPSPAELERKRREARRKIQELKAQYRQTHRRMNREYAQYFKELAKLREKRVELLRDNIILMSKLNAKRKIIRSEMRDTLLSSCCPGAVKCSRKPVLYTTKFLFRLDFEIQRDEKELKRLYELKESEEKRVVHLRDKSRILRFGGLADEKGAASERTGRYHPALESPSTELDTLTEAHENEAGDSTPPDSPEDVRYCNIFV